MSARRHVRVQGRREPIITRTSPPENSDMATGPCPTPLCEEEMPGVRGVQMSSKDPMVTTAGEKNPTGKVGPTGKVSSCPTKVVVEVCERAREMPSGGIEQAEHGTNGDEVAIAHGSGRSTLRERLSDPAAMAGLEAPLLDSQEAVTGGNKETHRKENKRKRMAQQERQEVVDYWASHWGLYLIPTPKAGPKEFKGSMCPAGLALHHPAAAKLLEYAMQGCPTKTGRDWTVQEMQEAIDKGPHVSALVPEAMEQLAKEVAAKEKKGQCRLVPWDSIKDNPPSELKVSPIAMIPHKSRLFRAILDLSFRLGLKCGKVLKSVNETSEKTAPKGAINQLGHSLMRMIHAFAQADEDVKIFMAKWDIKDGFWRLDCASREE